MWSIEYTFQLANVSLTVDQCPQVSFELGLDYELSQYMQQPSQPDGL
jgi:hypothetical protein